MIFSPFRGVGDSKLTRSDVQLLLFIVQWNEQGFYSPAFAVQNATNFFSLQKSRFQPSTCTHDRTHVLIVFLGVTAGAAGRGGAALVVAKLDALDEFDPDMDSAGNRHKNVSPDTIHLKKKKKYVNQPPVTITALNKTKRNFFINADDDGTGTLVNKCLHPQIQCCEQTNKKQTESQF